MLENFRKKPIRSRKILDSSRGQTCTARFPGICAGGTETTVWAHLNGGRYGKGMGVKAHDILGLHCCGLCHAYIDGGHNTKPHMGQDTYLECILGGVTETLVRLIVAGLVVIPLDAEKPAHERPVPARKPKEQRAPIQQRKTEWPKGRKMQSANTLRRKVGEAE